MSRILKNVHKSAERLHGAGFVDELTMREFDALCLPPLRDYTPEEIKTIRAGTKTSQAVFASFLNVRTITLAAWEEGHRKPNGTAIRMLDLIERKGLDVLR